MGIASSEKHVGLVYAMKKTPAPNRRPRSTSTRTSRISIASAKDKGRRLQQWVRDQLMKELPGVEEGDVTSTPMGVNGPDVGLSPLARRLFPWTVECKARAKFGIYSALEQAENSLYERTKPLVILRGDRKRPLALLYADDFLEVFKCVKTKKTYTAKK